MTPVPFDEERFSRWMAYVLRHNPSRYGLEVDQHGCVDFGQFVSITTRRYPELTDTRIRELVEGNLSQRFELVGTRLRARYGHSIPVEPSGAPVEPPEALYHGTEKGRLTQLLSEGLKPMDRQMLHLSETIDDALAVATRKTDQPLVLRVLAKQAHAAGITFHREGRVYLTRYIPPEFLALTSDPDAQPQ